MGTSITGNKPFTATASGLDPTQGRKPVSVDPVVNPNVTLHPVQDLKSSNAGVNVSDSYHADSGLGASASGSIAGLDLSGDVHGPSLSVSGNVSATASVNKGLEVDVNANIDASLASAHGDVRKTFPVTVKGQTFNVTLDLAANGDVGADGHIHIKLDIGRSGVSASASVDGFAGAKAGLTGTISVANADGGELAHGSLNLEAQAGVSGSAGGSVGIENGQLHFDAHASGAVGAGMGFHVSGNADPIQIGKAMDEMFLGGAVDDAVNTVVKDGEKVGGVVVADAKTVGHAVAGAASDTVNTAKNVGGWIGSHV